MGAALLIDQILIDGYFSGDGVYSLVPVSEGGNDAFWECADIVCQASPLLFYVDFFLVSLPALESIQLSST